MDVKNELEKRANISQTGQVRLSKSMTIVDMVKALEPEIRRALPAVITPERFTRMALSAINNTPELADCTPMSFIAALMNDIGAAWDGTKYTAGTGISDTI